MNLTTQDYDDPYNDFKKVHKSHLINKRGGVSPLCATTPRAINLKKDSWTLTDSAVTCAKCLEAMGVADAKAEAERRRRKQIDAAGGVS